MGGKTTLMKASEKSMVKMAKFPHETNTDMNVCDHNGTMFHFTVLNDHTEVLKVKVTLNQYVNTVVVFCTDFGWTSKNTLHAHFITDSTICDRWCSTYLYYV